MKKTFFTLMLMLASVVVINAQSLNGTWSTMLPVNDEEIPLVLDFADDGSCILGLLVSQDMRDAGMGMKMILNASLMMPGIYTRNGERLKFTFDRNNAEVDIDYVIDGVDEQAKKMMDSMIKPEIEKMKPDFMKEVLPSIPDLGEMKIVSLTNESLELAGADGLIMKFEPYKE